MSRWQHRFRHATASLGIPRNVRSSAEKQIDAIIAKGKHWEPLHRVVPSVSLQAGGIVTGILIVQIVLSLAVACIFLIRPAVTESAGWKIVAFIGLCALPALCIVGGMNIHMQRSEQTRFCISCHAMVLYGRSLYVDNPNYIPAQHFQNHRVPADQACYTCHADYTIFGPFKDKLRGITRIYMQYVSTPPNPIRIAGGYNNSNCLHCHFGARDFEGNPVHSALMESLRSNQVSCLTCHDMVHDVALLSNMKFWSPTK
jgi:cytochrome c-type protein NapC